MFKKAKTDEPATKCANSPVFILSLFYMKYYIHANNIHTKYYFFVTLYVLNKRTIHINPTVINGNFKQSNIVVHNVIKP